MTRLRLAWKILTGVGLVEALAAAKSCEGCDGRDYVIREVRRLLEEERLLRVRADERLIDSLRPRPPAPSPVQLPEQDASGAKFIPYLVPPGGF